MRKVELVQLEKLAISVGLVLLVVGLSQSASAAEVSPFSTTGWESEKSLAEGIQPRMGRGFEFACMSIAFDVMGDGKWVLISGEQFKSRGFHGFHWDGKKWVSDRSRVKGLGKIGNHSAPTMIANLTGDKKWTLIARNRKGEFFGYYWDRTKWVSDPARVKGLDVIPGPATITVMRNLKGDDKWTLISGNGEGTFKGYCWDGSRWVTDPAGVAGLGDVGQHSKPTAGFNVFGDKKWTLISGNRHGGFVGYYWDGKKWIKDPSRIKGLVGEHRWGTAPALACNLRGDGKWALITACYAMYTKNNNGFFCDTVSKERIRPVKDVTSVPLATAARIKWNYPHSWNHRVRYSTSKDMRDALWSDWRQDINTADVKLRHLKPETTYYYEACTYVPWDTNFFAKSPVGSFTTPAGRKLIRLKPGQSIQDAIDSLDPKGGTVKLLGGVHDVRDTIVINRNNVTIQGTHKSEIKAHDPARSVFALPQAKRLNRGWNKTPVPENIVLKGFKVTDAFGKTRAHCSLVRAELVRNLTVEGIMNTSGIPSIVSVGDASVRMGGETMGKRKNIIVRNNIAGNSRVVFRFTEDIHILNNTFKGFGSSIHIDRNNKNIHVIGNRVIGGRLPMLVDVGGPYEIRDNIFASGGGGQSVGVYLETSVRDTIIHNNTITGAYKGISIRWQGPMRNVTFTNNRIYGNTYGIYTLDLLNSSRESTINIRNNVIYKNKIDGVRMTSKYAKLNLTNNIIANNGGYGINRMECSVVGGYNNVWKNAQGNYNGCTAGSGDISIDPLFTDPTKGDFHLKSKAGRWEPKGEKWVKDNMTSPCIDAGDPKADFSKEPAHNGGRVNMGAYGNMAEASKSPAR